ncbi:3'-5' exonuclease [Sphingomonas psychrotolerans]|uniref:3'-5' exonuclease n=1 Tax=Sphingomonas psychrotolerans TaxID=1327635 RepID=A0A2K8MF76_9SPHN|nr:3'-5' exonuclease [Sphingomonas psychrotolerans]ATY32542.1 3'-5' exonuclease [Sphingomonas psychrotolerans]
MNERMWAVDIEGNGKTPPEIVEIAIVELRGLERTGLRRNWRLRPPSGIAPMASRIHGIWDRDVADAPDLEDVADDILVWLEGAPIVGHNVRVELEVLGRALDEWSPASAYDTLKLARAMLPDAPKHGLEALGARLGLDVQAASETGSTAHSALYDATLSAILLKYLLQPLSAEERRRRLAEIDLLEPPPQGQLI